MPTLYLASKSPRRLALLESIGVTGIEVIVIGRNERLAYEGDEERLADEPVEHYVSRTARQKALQAFELIARRGLPPAPVLAADTVVSLGETILGKPKDPTEEIEFLHRLSGVEHEVRTAVVVGTSPKDLQEALNVSTVRFRSLTEEEIRTYAETDEPYDKAGGYGIQGLAGVFVESVAGSYSGIMGLPVCETAQLLKAVGVDALFHAEPA